MSAYDPREAMERIKAKAKGGVMPPPLPDNMQAAETQALTMLITVIAEAVGNENDARLTQGEASSLINVHFGYGGINVAAKQTNQEYKTLAERCRVVDYYQPLSAGQKLEVGSSVAREMLSEYPVLTWTHLRVAKGLSKEDPAVAWGALEHAALNNMTPKEFKRYVAKMRRAAGHKPTKMIIQARAGYTVTIKRGEE